MSSFDEQLSQALDRCLTGLRTHLEVNLKAYTETLIRASMVERTRAAVQASETAAAEVKRQMQGELAEVRDAAQRQTDELRLNAEAQVAEIRVGVQQQLDEMRKSAQVQIEEVRRNAKAEVDEARRSAEAEITAIRLALQDELDRLKISSEADAEEIVISQLSAAQEATDRQLKAAWSRRGPRAIRRSGLAPPASWMRSGAWTARSRLAKCSTRSCNPRDARSSGLECS